MLRTRSIIIFVVCAALKEFPVGHCFKWLKSIDGSSHVRCVREEVTFPWSFEMEGGESLIGLDWSRQREGMADRESIASSLGTQFVPSVGYVSQVKEEGNAAIRMVDLTTADSGQYKVIVRLNGGQGEIPQQSVRLSVTEAPEVESGTLTVMLSNHTEAESPPATDSNGHPQLLCGRFNSLGSPQVNVVWEDPEGTLLESSSFDTSGGYFVLDLPKHYRGGNYICLLNQSSLSFSCLPDDSPLKESASLEVAAPVFFVRAAGLESGAVAGIVIGVLVVVTVAVVVTLVIGLKMCRRRGRKYSPKEPDSPDEEIGEPFNKQTGI